jgi:hypothetical protein
MRRMLLAFGAVALIAASLGACSSSSKSASSTTTAVASTTTGAVSTTTVPSLTEQITKKWEGAQIDTVGVNNPPTALLSGLVVHHGTWFASVPWGFGGRTGPNWCLGDVGTWKVLNAKSLTQFKVAYHDTRSYPPCNLGDTTITVTGLRRQNGRTVYSIRYPGKEGVGTRTVCSPVWNTPHPCGLTTGITLPTPPTQ